MFHILTNQTSPRVSRGLRMRIPGWSGTLLVRNELSDLKETRVGAVAGHEAPGLHVGICNRGLCRWFDSRVDVRRCASIGRQI